MSRELRNPIGMDFDDARIPYRFSARISAADISLYRISQKVDPTQSMPSKLLKSLQNITEKVEYL
jgi:hypothetical protein